MVIDLREFEHVFRTEVLKKGLSLFKNNAVNLFEKKADNSYSFFVIDKQQFEITLTKKGKKITNYHCTCNNLKNTCDHLCAVLFYFEKDALGFLVKEKNKKLKSVTTNIKKNNFKDYLYRIEYTELLNFIDKECEHNQLLKLQIITNFSKLTEQTIFENYCNKYKIILWNYLEIGKINEKQLNVVLKKIIDLKPPVIATNNSNLYFYYLALISELPQLFKLKNNDEGFYTLIFEAIDFVNSFCKNALKPNEIEALKHTAFQLIKNNKYFNIEFGVEIIKKSASLITNVSELLKFKNAIDKLKNSVYFLSELNNLEILKQFIAIKYSKLINTPILKVDDKVLTENTIAKAEFLLAERKVKAGFILLENLYKELEEKNDSKIISCINYILKASEKYNQEKIELIYLQNSLLYDIEIKPAVIQKLNALLNQVDFIETINTVINRLKQKNSVNSVSKIINLLNYCNRLNDIILELKLQHNQFTLLHTIALKNLPNYTIELLDVYVMHFIRAIQDAKYDFLKEPIFKQATKYINALIPNAQTYLVTEILKSIPKYKSIHQLIKKTYPLIS
jgi:hypothetical protein